MGVQPMACVWVSAFVCLSLMSDNEGQYCAISKHAVTQAHIVIHSFMQSLLILLWNRSSRGLVRWPPRTLWPVKNITANKTKRNTGRKKERKCIWKGEWIPERGAELSGCGAGRSGLYKSLLFWSLHPDERTATGGIMWDNCAFSPNPDLIGFYESPNHFQLSIFSDIP